MRTYPGCMGAPASLSGGASSRKSPQAQKYTLVSCLVFFKIKMTGHHLWKLPLVTLLVAGGLLHALDDEVPGVTVVFRVPSTAIQRETKERKKSEARE